jgi:hypothetical protein
MLDIFSLGMTNLIRSDLFAPKRRDAPPALGPIALQTEDLAFSLRKLQGQAWASLYQLEHGVEDGHRHER